MSQRNAVNEDEIAAQQRRATTSIVIAIVVILILAVLAWLWLREADEPQAPIAPETPVVEDAREQVEREPDVDTEPRAEPEPEREAEPTDEPPEVLVPEREEEVEAEPLPDLNESTSPLLSELSEQNINTRPVRSSHVIRDLVIFVKNLSEGDVIRESATIGGPDARFQTQRIDEQLYIDERSYARYDELVDWFVNMDTAVLVDTFERYSPLFEQAHAEIARPDSNFHDQVMQAIELLLETPEPEGLLALSDDRVMYTYADPELEELPAAQKQMLRMGPDNQRRVKEKLRDIREALAERTN
ncbi:DUF3014 domain-containing protein [Aliidiomarina minuta]|uniref:DUF3014 domain-containing protein n=1 Tax=Aliidiomarina minuta TaxID=880057 RepID=A0A432W4S7_9GAMM|nr:DUF3014 domain-containing protein [Aliidiomarina minuta]RUO24407.1 DUF3014 domain-containing protein [Aliidiomarina minuta]